MLNDVRRGNHFFKISDPKKNTILTKISLRTIKGMLQPSVISNGPVFPNIYNIKYFLNYFS